MSFQDDIKGQNTQLFPIVTIEPPDAENRLYTDVIDNECVFLSTNNVSLDHIHSVNTAQTPFRNHHFKPLLLNIPSIKESMDVESRKFKISSVNLSISNIEYEGQRFSDILSDTSLMNWLVSVQFVSSSAKLFSTIFDVDVWAASPDVTHPHPSFYNAYNTPWWGEDYNGEAFGMTKMVYQGIIRKISHDDTKVKISIEDLTEQKSHKDLPQLKDQNGIAGYLEDTENIPSKYRNQPIPMVYGHVSRSPLVATTNYKELLADSKDISEIIYSDSGFVIPGGAITYAGLFMDVGGKYVSVSIHNQYSQGDSIKFNANNTDIFPDITSTSEPFLKCFDDNSDFNFSIKNRIHPTANNDLHGEDFFVSGSLDKITDGLNESNPCVLDSSALNLESYAESTTAFVLVKEEILFLEFMFNYAPNYDYDSAYLLGFKINGINLPNLLQSQHGSLHGGTVELLISHVQPLNGGSGAPIDGIFGDIISGVSGNYHQFNAMATQAYHPEIDNLISFQVEGNSYLYPSTPINLIYTEELEGFTTSDVTGIMLFDDTPNIETLNIQFRGIWSLDWIDSYSGTYSFTPQFELNGELNEFSLLRRVDVTKIFSKDFYANVRGRINTFDDHPELNDNVFFENPIDIIYDLVRKEIGHDNINEVEYTEAKAAHPDWKFGFTVNKKINSRKLIEEIAKSTKCFPKFKSDGSFGFNTIKDNYSIAEYEATQLIKELEVISYSFKKTKPEQIYKNVTVSYNKDYAQDSYFGITDPVAYDLGADDYYGIESSSDAYLEFESDYIRHDGTAEALRNFLLAQYKNDHLIFNLKLPLQYIDLEIGDLVKFRELLGGVKAYGIDYRIVQNLNGQHYYPLFVVTSTTKNLDSVSIECMQLHHLPDSQLEGYGAIQGEGIDFGWYDGIPQSEGGGIWGSEEGLFYFPDSDSIVILDPPDISLIDDLIYGTEVIVPNLTYEFQTLEDGSQSIIFHKQNEELLFDFTIYDFLTEPFGATQYDEGVLIYKSHPAIKVQDNLGNVGLFKLVSPLINTYDAAYMNVEELIGLPWYNEFHPSNYSPLNTFDDNGDLIITEILYMNLYPLGDLNFDGGVNVQDIVKVINGILTDWEGYTEEQVINADINQDSFVNILDVIVMTNIIMD